MTLTKDQIIEKLLNRFNPEWTRVKTIKTVETLLELIKKPLETGEDVMISNFGKFTVKEKSERKGRNPATGGSMMLPARKVVTFKPAIALRDKINNNDKS